jgi:GntR family transcriptional regulator, transcriptional repressor for pyruvate dehydrogenase complex
MTRRPQIAKPLDVGPLRSQRSMTEELAERISAQILAGELQSNNRLPTVQEMASRFGVSRTVIRETVALLKADGLIVVRHGSGMFVAGDARRRPLRIDPDNVTGVRDIIEIVQVRLGLEVEAAGLAATFRTPAQLRKIGAALKAMAEAGQKKMLATDEDRLFHTEIAAATGNQYFVVFLEFLGRYVIPRSKITIGRGTDEERAQYLAKLEAEHKEIFQAITDKDPDAARQAMRRHLKNALDRLEQLKPEERADAERMMEQRWRSSAD